MASLIFNSALTDEATGAVDYDTDTFYVMLVGDGYDPDKKNDSKRSDVIDEITGDGYTAGGVEVDVTVAEDDANDRVDIELGGAVWNPASITAYGAVYYKRRGGAASADELIYYNDFGGPITSTNAAFTLEASTIRKQN